MNVPNDSQKLKAFVIGPIGDRDAEQESIGRRIYEQGIEALENIITPACSALDIEAYRSDNISNSGEIPEQVFRALRDSHIVVADLTDANPNVMYELGLRHTTGKLTVQIGERGKLPFDISTIRTILFKRSEIGFIEARRSLIRALAEGLDSGGDPVTATRVWFEISSDYESETVELKDEPASNAEEEEELGFLELIAETESGINDIGQTLSTGASILSEITRALEDGTSKIESLPTAGNYSASKVAITNRIAASLEDPAVRFNIVAQDYARHAERAAPGMLYILKDLAKSPEQLSEAGEFIESIAGLVGSAIEHTKIADKFAETMQKSGNATRSLKKVTASILRSNEKIRDASRVIASWRSLLDDLEEQG